MVISSVCSHAADLSAFGERFLLRNWTVQDDLPQNTVTVVEQTSDGYLWLGTPSGLLRFDGLNFTHFNRRNTEILHSETISCLHEDFSGALWIGTQGGGLYLIKNGQWYRYGRENGLSNDNVRAIASDWNGNIWIGTDYGLNRLKNGDIEIFTTNEGLPDNIVTDLQFDLNGTLWIATLQNGIACFTEGSFQLYGFKEGLHCPDVNDIYIDATDKLWIGTVEGLFVKPSNSQMIDFIPETEYIPVTSIENDTENSIWIASMTGEIIHIRNLQIDQILTAPGLNADLITDLCLDLNNNLWFSTELSGLFQIKPKLVSTVSHNRGLPKSMISTVFFGSDETIWMGTKSNGLFRMTGNENIQPVVNNSKELSTQTITAICQDHIGQLWIGTQEAGLFIVNNKNVSLWSGNPDLSSLNVTSIVQDSRHGIWVGTSSGLNRISDSEINQPQQFKNIPITILRATENKLYVGTENGLYLGNDGGFGIIPSTEKYHITAVLSDSANKVWIGTNGNGLQRLMGDSIFSISTTEHFFTDYIFSILKDHSGNFWFSSYDGVFCYSKRSLNNLFDDPENRSVPLSYDENEGLISRQCSNIGQPSLAISKDGFLYCATIGGISTIDTKRPPHNSLSPIIIESIKSRDKSIPIDNTESVKIEAGSFLIQFTAIDLSAPEKCHFWYKLEDFDDRFRYLAPGSQRTARYTDIRPGSYKFTVQAANNSDIRTVREKNITIIVPKPLIGRPWFILSLILILTALFFTVKARYHNPRPQPDKYATSTLTEEKFEETVPQLLRLMEKEKMYLDPNLTLKDLTRHLHIHANHLSQIINAKFDVNFNDFINNYRITEAKKQLTASDKRHLTVLEIMFDCGFNSKSVFNTAFKKFTGTTPSEYRRKYS